MKISISNKSLLQATLTGTSKLEMNVTVKRCLEELIASCNNGTRDQQPPQKWSLLLSDNLNGGEESNVDSDSECDDEGDSDVDSVAEEEENEMVKQMVSAALVSKSMSNSNFTSLLNSSGKTEDYCQRPLKRARLELPSTLLSKESCLMNSDIHLPLSPSLPCVRPLPSIDAASQCMKAVMSIVQPRNETQVEVMRPHDYLNQRFKKAGIQLGEHSFTNCGSFFYQYTQVDKDSYDSEVIQAVRSNDIDTLRALHKQGRSMQCVNAFGHSIVHLACRRGQISVLTFLLEEAKINVRVCCENGRTPLHDACWTADANLAVASLLLDVCPDLLFIKDKRGHTPLQFVHRSNWEAWNSFLDRRQIQHLMPTKLA